MPKFIVWNNEYSVQNSHLDQQHQIIFDLINDLFVAKTQNIKIGKRELLQKLVDYSLNHLKEEENFFEGTGYPYIQEHKQAHQQFITFTQETLLTLKKDLAVEISSDTLQFLKTWWQTHILQVDRQYVGYLGEG